MTRPLLVLLAFLVCGAPVAAAERTYSVTDFERVVVEGPYIVRLAIGRSSAARASGSQAALDRVLIEVTGQTLRIRRNRHYWGGNPGAQEGPLTIELSTRILRSARLVGPARLEVDGAEGLRVDLAVEGSGRLRAVNVAADALSLGLVGSGRLEVAGTADTVTANVQGSGDLDASGLRAGDATINTTTAGTVAMAVADTAAVSAYGLGTIEISGRPACTVRGPSAALVRCGSDQR